MLTDLTIAAAFLIIFASVGSNQQIVQCKYCTKHLFAKHTSRQQNHLEGYYGYLQD